MKDKMKGLIAGLTIGSLLSGTAAYAAGDQIEVTFRNLKYMFDGVEKAPVEGKSFIYEGTTYVPLRFVSESLGKPVEWDEANETIWIGMNPNQVVATYQGGQITRKQFDTYLAIQRFLSPAYAGSENNADHQKLMIKNLIKDMILSSRASAADQAAAADQAQKQIDSWKAHYSQNLAEAGITESDLLQFLTAAISSQKAAASGITEEKLQAKYEASRAEDPGIYTVASVRHILIATMDAATGQALRTKEEALARAKEVQQLLKTGGDFAQLAKEYSDDPGSKDSGGLYSDAEVSQWVVGFKKAAVELPIGTISDPVETEYGYHIMKVESRREQSLDEVRNKLVQQLTQESIQSFFDQELPGLIEKIDLEQ